jgi:four helix bundle protein
MGKKSAARKFEDLEAWQEARALTSRIYAVTSSGAFSTDFPLRNQIRRSAISIACNIAEGFDRFNPREFRHFLSISKASCAELRAQLYLALDQNYLDEDALNALMDQSDKIGRQLSNLMVHLQNQARKK